MWEGVIRVPALIRWTGKIQGGQTVNTTASLTDLMPTVLELTNQSADEVPSDGQSLLPVLFDSATEHLNRFIFHYTDIAKPAAVSFGSFKLVFFTYKGTHKP